MPLPIQVVAEAEHELAPLLMDPLAFAGVAVAVFVLLGFITWSFRDVANRHRNKWPQGGGTGHGADGHSAGH
jgi:hypothetical protein